MSFILSIETSTKGCSVALHQSGNLLAISELNYEKSSSGMLTILIQHVLKVCGIAIESLDAIAVAKGPGSYTGLRIGVSTAKGLCFTLDKPLIAVNTLESMAYLAQEILKSSEQDLLLCPMLDARRMEVYCAIYAQNGNLLRNINETEAKIINEDSFQDILNSQKILFFGDGADKCKSILENHPNAYFLNQNLAPSAKSIGAIASKYFIEKRFEDVAAFEPYYLKEFIGTTPKIKN